MTPRVMCLQICAFLLLAACGGSGANVDQRRIEASSPEQGSADATVFARYVSEAQSLADELQGRPFTDLDTLPRSGQAIYRGFLGGQITRGGSEDIKVSGRANVIATFRQDGAALTGDVSDVMDDSGREWRGTLSLENASVSRATDQSDRPAASGFIVGQLQDDEDVMLRFDLRFEASIYGQAYKYMGGQVGGIVQETSTASRFDGEIVAAK